MEGYSEFNEWLSRWKDMTEQERIDTPIASYEMLACWQAATERAAQVAASQHSGKREHEGYNRGYNAACADLADLIRKG